VGTAWMIVVLLATLLLLFSGCAWSIGGRKEGESHIRPTQGQ
jgi:hypothetical protein